jgi:tricarballylate dehydrogenase
MMVDLNRACDVLVLGGGNAGICAAMTARETGASVLLIEHAPRAMRGGNSRHTRNLRIMHEAPTATLTGRYDEAEYWKDLLGVTKGKTDERLARLTIRATSELLPWMDRHGVRFQPSLSGTLHLSRTNAFFLGGGKALLNAYYASAERAGIDIVYNTEVRSIHLVGDRVESVSVGYGGISAILPAKAVVVSSGGF